MRIYFYRKYGLQNRQVLQLLNRNAMAEAARTLKTKTKAPKPEEKDKPHPMMPTQGDTRTIARAQCADPAGPGVKGRRNGGPYNGLIKHAAEQTDHSRANAQSSTKNSRITENHAATKSYGT